MNWKNYWIASLVLVIAAVLFNVACDDCTCKDQQQKTRIVTPPAPTVQPWQDGQGEVLYDGYIRIADWNKKSVTYESAYGYIKTIGPICGSSMPVWAGMHLYELNFHWNTNDNGYNRESECYAIDYVLHAPTGDYKP